ncbi:hypothetical protein BDM02DRAFT_3119215 [Thelephora ganbajun]|uniref:Uncharacterized protein n=1 Tax=Thelephora ganbajun TaxID=370292 RepID=A0ACB6Z9A9_THEGA|nr:hypothetical protein BDM02DRAFT_3119215 [Thelephora ganbajun]
MGDVWGLCVQDEDSGPLGYHPLNLAGDGQWAECAHNCLFYAPPVPGWSVAVP